MAHDHATDEGEQPAAGAEGAAVEAYEVEGGVVFYDADNPMAWVEARSTVELSEAR